MRQFRCRSLRLRLPRNANARKTSCAGYWPPMCNIRSMCEIAARRSAMTRNADSFAAKSLGEAERHRRANKASADLILAAQPHVEKALAVGEKSIAELLAMLAGPTVELSDMQLVEFRTTLSGKPKQDRVRAIIRSIEKGSDQLVAAVLGCDRFLTEDFLSDVELSAIREAWGRARQPDECRLLAQRQSDLAHLKRGASVIQSWQRQTHNPAIADTVIQAGGTSGRPLGSPYGNAGVGGIAGVARRARGMQ